MLHNSIEYWDCLAYNSFKFQLYLFLAVSSLETVTWAWRAMSTISFTTSHYLHQVEVYNLLVSGTPLLVQDPSPVNYPFSTTSLVTYFDFLILNLSFNSSLASFLRTKFFSILKVRTLSGVTTNFLNLRYVQQQIQDGEMKLERDSTYFT